jgi:Raf kinase inhibitor-like YbhB/YbcL family protein
MKRLWLTIFILALNYFAFTSSNFAASLTLTSSAFQNNAMIPIQYTKEGQNLSPPLAWANVPKGTKSFVLMCDDPDAPGGTWTHWVLYNIPPTLTHLEEGSKNLPPQALIGKNSWGELGYGGPQPPSGTHHYHFTLYALDTELKVSKGENREEILKALKNHVLDQATLVGLYQAHGQRK